MDFQNTDNMLNSLITSGDFSDVSFLLNGNDGTEAMRKMNWLNGTMTIDNVTPTRNITNNLMDFTFDVNRTIQVPCDATFTADTESPMKEYGIENADMTLSESIENLGKNLTFDAHTNGGNITWDKIQDHQNKINQTIVQSTPVCTSANAVLRTKFDDTMSPIRTQAGDDDEEEVIVRNLKERKLVNNITAEDYRNSMEDQCEFLLNEETIKLSSRFGGESFECLDMKSALESADANEKDFDKMLDSFNVTKSLKSASLLQSVDNIKQRHSLINFEKQREEKQRKDEEYDNKTQYDAMNKSSERLLRRSRLYDDVNLQLQKQQNETFSSTSAKPEQLEDEEVVDRNSRDRFKTIKLNKKLQTGMVVVTDDEVIRNGVNDNSTSPGTNKEKRNQLNQQKQETEDVESKKNPIPASKLSKFGFSRPTYRSRNDLNLPLKANSTDSLDDEPRAHNVANIKSITSPMGIKSKSIHNLMFNGTSGHHGSRADSYGNLRLIPGAARSQSNLKTQRTSSLVRPSQDQAFKV